MHRKVYHPNLEIRLDGIYWLYFSSSKLVSMTFEIGGSGGGRWRFCLMFRLSHRGSCDCDVLSCTNLEIYASPLQPRRLQTPTLELSPLSPIKSMAVATTFSAHFALNLHRETIQTKSSQVCIFNDIF